MGRAGYLSAIVILISQLSKTAADENVPTWQRSSGAHLVAAGELTTQYAFLGVWESLYESD